MNELDQMFQAPKEVALPPLVQSCKQRIDAGDRIEVGVYRPDESSRTFLVIHRWKRGRKQDTNQVEWDDGVNTGLVDLRIKAINIEQEGERFALGIRAVLRKVERKYGDGYLNAVLVDLLNESNLRKEGEIAEVMEHIKANSPEQNSRSYIECRKLIANELSGRAVELREKLGYNSEDAKAVMTKAIAIYLDERFSVSARRRFGWL